MSVVELVLGPLAGPECRRSLGRRWVRWGQTLAGLPALLVTLAVLWVWWFFSQFDARFLPGGLLLGGVVALEGMMLVVALVMSPAVAAGTLAGEKARGVLPLLLASRVSAREIVTGRLAGRLALAGWFLLASLPAMCLLSGFSSLPARVLLVLIALPAAVSFGACGMALLTSALARRGWDALFAVYLVELVLFLAPLLGVRAGAAPLWALVGPMNPFYGLGSLVGSTDTQPALISCGLWITLGLVALSLASCQLRRVYLRQVDDSKSPSRWRRRVRPPIGAHPMLWKEIHFERIERFSRFVRWLGIIVFLSLLSVSFILVGIITWSRWTHADDSWEHWATMQLEMWVSASALPVSWLIQWTIALRAAVAIAAEREHGTWDPLILTPFEGREIVLAKIGGSLYSLRGFIACAAIVWTVAVLYGVMQPSDYWTRLANTVIISVFMTAAGVWLSLSTSTATRAMTFTIGTWLLSAACFAMLAGIVVAVTGLVITMVWLYWRALSQNVSLMGTPIGAPPFPMSFPTAWTLTRLSIYALAAFLIAAYCRVRFDRLAGRAPG